MPAILGTADLKPWFVEISFFAIVIYPIGALELNSTAPLGMSLALLLLYPSTVMSSAPFAVNLALDTDKSFGVSHAMPFLQ